MADDTDTLTQDKPQTDRFGGVRVGAQQRDKFGGIKVGAAPAASPEASNNKLADIASGVNQTVGGVLSGAGAWLSGPPTPGMLNERAMERAYRESDASQRNYARILPQEPAYQSTAQRPGEGASRTLDEIQSNPLNRYGQFVSETGEMFAPKNPTTVDKILQGAGGFAPIVATGPAAPLTMGLQATGESLKNQYDKYKKQGMTDEEASRQALTVAKGTGITQALLWEIAPKPIKNAVQKVTGKVGGNALAKFLIRRASGATEGAALGGSSQALYNLTTGQPIQQGVAPAAGAMAVIGGITPQPELKEKQYATTEKQVKEGVQPQRQEGNGGGKAAETGGGNSLQRPTEGKPTVPPEIDKAARLNELRAIKDPTTEQKTELAALEKASKATNDRIAFVLKQKPGWQFREVPQATETEGLSPEQKAELKNINDKYGWEFSRPIPGGMADTVYVPVGSSYSEIVKALNDKEEQMAGGDKANAAGLPNHLSPFADLFEDPHVFGPAKLEKAGLTRAEVIQKLQDLAKTRKPEQFQDMAAWVVDPAHQARTPNGALSAMRFNFDPDPELHEKEMAKKRLPQPPQPAPKPMPEPDISGEPTDEERLKQINKGIRKASGGGRPEKGEEQVPLQVGETVNRVINGQPVTGKVIQNGSQIIVAFRQGNREVGDHDLSQWTRGKGADRPVGDIAYPQDKFIKDFLKETRIKQKGRVAALPTVLEEHYPGLMEEARVGEEKYRNQLLREGITPGPGSPIMTALAEAAKAQDEWNRNQATGRYYLGASQEKVDRAIEALRQLLGEKSPIPDLAAEGLKEAARSKEDKTKDALRKLIEREQKRIISEQEGQAILDDAEHDGRTINQIKSDFFENVYPKLDPAAKARMDKFLQASSGGLKPGDVIGTKPGPNNTRIPWVAESWEDIVEPDANTIDQLSGTDRGLVSVMEYGNKHMKSLVSKLPPEDPEDVPTEKELAAKAARAKYEALKADQPYSKATKAAHQVMLDAEHERDVEAFNKALEERQKLAQPGRLGEGKTGKEYEDEVNKERAAKGLPPLGGAKPGPTPKEMADAIGDAFVKTFASLKKQGWTFQPDWSPLEVVLDPKSLDQFMFMGKHPHPTEKGITLYEYKNGVTRHYLRVDDEGNAYGYNHSATGAAQYPKIPLEEAIDKSFEGLPPGATRETKYNAEFIKQRNEALEKAGFGTSTGGPSGVITKFPKPGPEAGFGIVPQPPKFLSEFVKQDVAPFVGRAVDAARAAKNLIVHAFSPSTGVKPEDVDILYSSKGFKEKFITQAAAALETARKEMGKLPHDQQIAFVDRIKLGQKQPTPEMQHMADVLRTWDDKLYNMAKEFAPGLNYLDDHYRVLWKVIPGSQGLKGAALEQFMAKRPWRGSRGFQLRHVLDTMSEGIAKGGVPVSYNPIEMFMLHAQDVTKFVSANRAWRNFKDSGAVEFVKTGKERPPSYVKVDDSIARPYFKTDEGVLAKTGEYYMEPNSARMLNNYLSRDHMRTGAFGNIGTGLMDLKNATTSIELSASPFHAVFETNEAVGSALGLAIAKMGEGRLIEGGSEFLRTLPGTLPIVGGFIPKTGNMEALKLGSKIVEFAKSPDDFRAQYPDAYKFLKQKYPDFEEMVDDMFTGGGQIGMHENYHIQAAKGLQEAWANKNYIGAGLRGIPAGLQLALRPIFDIYIPRLKLGTWAREYAFELERRAPELQKGTLTRNTLARDTWAFVEDRFGELNWDNLYWNRTFKSVLQLMFRSVTWKLGNIRGFGKAVRDAGHELGYNWYKDTMVGEMARAIPKGPGAVMERFRNAPSGQISTPKITLPMAWLAGMALVTTIQSTILSKLFTGKYPWQLATGAADLVRNLTYPRISNNDSSQRVNIPTYWKDMIHLVHDPVSYVRSSMTGEIGRIFDIWQNKDFYGREVYHPDDPMLKRVADRFAHLIPVPFSASSVYAARQSGASRVQSGLGMVGYTKAPYYVSHSKAEQAADELIRNSLPLGARTKEEYNKTIREKQGVMAIKRGEMTMEQAVDQGLIADNRQKEAMNQSDESVLMYHFTRLKPEDQLKVYKLATKDERDQLSSKGENMHDMIEDKIFRSRSLSDDEKDQLTTELEELTNETK